MKCLFTLVLMALLPYVGALAGVTSAATDEVRYIVMADGQVVAIPEKYVLGEKSVDGVCTLSLEGGETFVYRTDEVVSISDSYDVSSARLLSFGFTHADNDQVYADVEATIAEEGDKVLVTADVPVIGKRLRPRFTVSEGVTVWLDGVQQVSGKSSLRFEEPVTYTLALPKHWIYEVETVEDDDTGGETVPEDGWIRTKVDISSGTTTNAPSNHAGYQGLNNLWDDSPETYYHSTWGDNMTYPKLTWVEGGFYGDGITEWPYVQMELSTTLENFCLSYTTSNQNNRFPQGWRITAQNKTTGEWDEIDVLTMEEHALPQMNLQTYTTPIYALGGNYTAIRLELTQASYKNYMVISDLSLYECVEADEEPAIPSEPTDPEMVAGFRPFGRQCQVDVRYLTDYATGDYKIPAVYITFGDGVTWDYTQWIGQTLVDEMGNEYNTKEEWIADCTFRLDGAGIWPDIDTVEGCEVRGRGNSTWSWSYRSKNPYRIKFPKKAKQSPFNLTEGRQWVLISNKQNGSMTTNAIAQKVAAMVDADAICHMIPVDLYINGHYRGSYCFTEKIGIADNSVAIDEATGCLLELDDYYDEDFRFRDATYHLPVNVKDPDFTEEDAKRVVTFEEVQASMNSLTATLASGGDITRHVDMESWAKFWLVNDLVRNVETYHPKSCYMFNEDPAAGGRWKFGPAWDFDWAFGYEESGGYFSYGAEEDLYSRRSGKAGYNFYNALRNTEAAKRAYYKEWRDFVAEGRVEELVEYIADYTEFALLSIAHNNDADISEKNSTNYEALVTRSQQWIEARANYIAEHLTAYDEVENYLVTFLLDGEVYHTEYFAYGETIRLPKTPTKKGHTFSGWSGLPETMPARDITVSGTFTVNQYQVTFKIGDEVIAVYMQDYGSVIVVPEAPEKEGHTFNGWGNVPETVPAANVTYEGSYSVNSYTITYSVDGEVIHSESVAYGATVTALDEPVKEGHTFSGWSGLPETMPAEDVTVSGTFTVNQYQVTFKIGDEVIAVYTQDYGSAIVAPEAPEKEGHTFNGWDDLPEMVPAGDITVSGTYTVNQYQVTFKIGGEVIAVYTQDYGSAIVAPEAPEKEGHTFNGWGNVAETVPASDLVYEGTYTVNSYNVYYYVGEKLVHTAEVVYGEPIPEYIYEPEEEGYTFLGWVGEKYETMPAHDVTYTANIDDGIDQLTKGNGQLTIYDLTGRKVLDTENLKGGIYIINGRKVLIDD